MTDEVGGKGGKDDGPLVCSYLIRHQKTSSNAGTIDSLSKSIKPLSGILFEADIAT